ncbi:hypothetical protein JCM21900_000994 [Sporobolomyces salmonicolor]
MSPDLSPQDRLQADFSPPLDSALIYAILLDFPSPLSTADERSARAILESLAREADAEAERETIDHQLFRGIDRLDGASELPGEAASSAVREELTSLSELSSALEDSSLNDGADGGAGRGTPGQRFWTKSGASSTSEEGAAAVPSRDKLSPFSTATPSSSSSRSALAADSFEADEFADDPLAFLASVFPEIELSILQSKLASLPLTSSTAPSSSTNTAAPHDLESLVEDLLSQDLISSLVSDDSSAALFANPPPDFDAEARATLSKMQKRRLKQSQKAKASFSLTSTPPVPSPRQHETDPLATAGTATALSRAPATSNAWASISSHASHLSSLLHIPPARISSTYYASSTSLPLTLSTLLTQLSASRPFAALPHGEELKSQLRMVLPRSTREDTLEVLLSATEGDLSDALDLKRFIDETELAQGKVLALNEMVATGPVPSSSSSSLSHTRTASTGAAAANGFIPVHPSSRSPVPSAGLPTPSSATPDRLRPPAECYALAAHFLEKRNQAFRTAARSFQRGGVGERGAAGYWAEQGREYERERRRWEERGAKAVVAERRRTHDPHTVDLHGLTLSHALAIVDEACNTWWSQARDTRSPTPLRIITGVGRHSRNQVPILAPAVTKHLDKHGWRWKWDDGPLVAGGLGMAAGGQRGAVRVIGVR